MIKINDKNQIVIYPVIPIMQNGEIEKFVTSVTLKEIGEIYPRLTYDGNAQRGYKIKKIGKGKDELKIKEKMIDKEHADSIKDAYFEGKDVKGNLVWNVRIFDDIEDLDLDYYEYDSVRSTLTIIGNTITLPDSAHRHVAIHQIYKDDKYADVLDNECILEIYNYNLKDEINTFVDTNGKAKPVERNRVLFLSNDIKCQLVRDVINSSNLNNRVEIVTRYAKDDKLITFAALYDSLFGKSSAGAYKDVSINKNNYEDYKEWLIKFYNELLITRQEFNFTTSKEKKEFTEENMIVEALTWNAYAYMSKVLKDDTNWKRSLTNKMNKTVSVGQGIYMDFWSKANTIWHGGILLYNYNYTEQKVEASKSVRNSNATKKTIQKIVAMQLFN